MGTVHGLETPYPDSAAPVAANNPDLQPDGYLHRSHLRPLKPAINRSSVVFPQPMA